MSQQHPSKSISLPIGNKKVEDLLLWRDPYRSGAVFGAITLTYLLLEWTNFSLLTVLSNLLLGAVCVCFLWNNIASFTNKSGVPVPVVLKEGVKEGDVKAFAERTTDLLNKILGFAYRLALGKDVLLSAKVAAGLFFLGKFGNWFSTLGLLYTVAVLAFTLPKAYELKKDEVDALAGKVSKEVHVLYHKYLEPYVNKIPRASTSHSPGKVHEPVEKKAQ